MYIFLVFLILLILLIVFLFTSVIAITEFNENKFILEIYFYKFKLFGNKKETSKKYVTNAQKENSLKQKLSIEKINFYINLLKKILEDVKKIFRYFKRKIKASKFFLSITFGLEDAAETGIATGMLWAFIGFVYPLVDTVFDIDNPEISVNPKFNCECFNMEYKGIYKLKIIHIIYIALCAIKIILKLKKEIKNGGV